MDVTFRGQLDGLRSTKQQRRPRCLAVWIHKDKGAKLTNELLEELRLGGEDARE